MGTELINPDSYGLKKLTYTVSEAMELLSVGRTTLYRLIKKGDLKHTKIGGKTVFCSMDIASFIRKLQA